MICEKEKCTACGACLNICPTNAIEMKEDERGFYQVYIHEDKCIHCDACKRACPILNLKALERDYGDVAYGVWNLDEKVRTNSSSGGAFGVLASYILKQGGVVYGAAYQEDLSVAHIKIEDIKELSLLQGSKYVQSNTGKTYCEIMRELQEGKKVLFSGTPCQVAGLYGYLGKDYEALLTCEFVCHGVPASGVYRTYIEELEKEHGAKVSSVNFRYRGTGKSQCLKVTFDNGSSYVTEANAVKDAYYFGFIMNCFLRDNCHQCRFVERKNRTADFIIGDFGGMDLEVLAKAPDKVPSLFLLNSVKAKKVFKEIQAEIYYVKRTVDEAIVKNKPLVAASKPNRFRSQFLDEYVKKRTVLKSKYIKLAQLEFWCKMQILKVLRR